MVEGLAWLLMLLCLSSQAASPAPNYVGSDTCTQCHREASEAWHGSHHAQAMQRATPASVLGDFKGARFEYHGQVTEFFRRGHRYWVRTEGADGQRAAFEATHVLGVYPLQQLLIALPRGRLQAFGIAWDARPRTQGGQRWYALYPDDPPPPGDALHWSGRDQTANFMCNGCHTTGYRKQYDAATDGYRSTQAELGVGCEACHGPGAGHRDWATRGRPADANKGFATPQTRLNRLIFAFLPGHPIAQAQGAVADGQAAGQVCQGCHARRSQLVAQTQPHAPFLDQYGPSLISPGLYHPDGRIDGEVFEHGSFAQSAMHAAGVTCTHCHDAHSLKPRAPGNALCSQCHLPARYETGEHGGGSTPAPVGAAAAAARTCVGCHMPSTTYMGVHVRHDHSLRVPGAPARAGSAFVQASALARGEQPQALPAAVQSPAPLLRYGAAKGLAHRPLREAAALGASLLADERLAVRIEAARALAGVPLAAWPVATQQAVQRATDELVVSEQQSAERPEAQVNLAQIHLQRGQMVLAEQALRRALVLAPGFVPARVNLADLLRRLGRDGEGEPLLREAVALAPRDDTAAHALGLWLVRQRRVDEALPWLRRAWVLAPQRAGNAQVLVLALKAAGLGDEAREVASQAGLGR